MDAFGFYGAEKIHSIQSRAEPLHSKKVPSNPGPVRRKSSVEEGRAIRWGEIDRCRRRRCDRTPMDVAEKHRDHDEPKPGAPPSHRGPLGRNPCPHPDKMSAASLRTEGRAASRQYCGRLG